MDELKIAAAIIYASMINKGIAECEPINNDQTNTAYNYWRIYEAFKTSPDNPENKT